MTVNIKGGLSVEDIALMTGGNLINKTEKNVFSITTDSREFAANSLFVAIRGERFNGNDYIVAAFENGAVCALTDSVPEDTRLCAIVVPDARKALGMLAKAYKEKINPLTVAVTGSIGKTTTKEFIYAVLSEKYNTLKTGGNHNNDIGLPMSLLGLSPENDAAVLEMGMSQSGEIEYLSKIACPNIAVITNIGTSHIEHLGSREAIRDAKMEIRKGLMRDGILILNGDEPLLADVDGAFYVGRENVNADYHIENIVEGENGTAFDLVIKGEKKESIVIPTIGEHNVFNAAYAWAVGISAGLGEFEIRRGLMKFKNAAMRQNIYNNNGKVIMEDCYNASPESMLASLKVLSGMAKRKKCRSVAVLGDMCELGSYSKEGHKRVGVAVSAYDIDVLITFGEQAQEIAYSASAFGMKKENIYIFKDTSDAEALGRALCETTKPSDIVLFKASRAIALERAIAYISK